MASIPILKASGLYTSSNEIGSVPDGAMTEAKNVVIRSKDIVEPRRGIKPANASGTGDALKAVRALGSYNGSILAFHTLNSTSAGPLDAALLSNYDGTGTLTLNSGFVASPTDGAAVITRTTAGTLRPRVIEAAQSAYFSDYSGVKKIDSVTGAIKTACLPKPQPILFPQTSTTAAAPPGTLWMTALYWAGYVVVYGIKDANGRIILSEPSSPAYAQAGATTSRGVLTIRLPKGLTTTVTTSHFVQLYRTVSAASKDLLVPDYYQVYEAQITSSDITTGTITVYDNTPDAALSRLGYFSANGEGLAEANNEPPLCVDMCLFGSRMLYANTGIRHGFYLDILGVDPDSLGTGGLKPGDKVIVNTVTFTASLNHRLVNNFEFAIDTSGGYDGIYKTARYLADCINATTTSACYAYPIADETGSPGALYIEKRDVAFAQFTVAAEDSVGAAITTAFSPVLPNSANAATSVSTNEEGPNRIYWSKRDIPEAVPRKNYLTVGAKNKKIMRLVAVRDRVYVFKEDGIFSMSGEAPYRVYPLDPTVKLLAPDSVAAVNNEVYALTNKGVVKVSDAGVQIVSKGIERDLARYINDAASSTNLYTGTWACGYETGNLYLLGIASSNSYASDRVYCFNTASAAWTWWDIQARCGLVDPATNRLYLGGDDTTSGAGANLNVERKTLTNEDYHDGEEYQATATAFEFASITPAGGDLYDINISEAPVVGTYLLWNAATLCLVTVVTDLNNVRVQVISGPVPDVAVNSGLNSAELTLAPYDCIAEWTAKAPGGTGASGTIRSAELAFRDAFFNTAQFAVSTDAVTPETNPSIYRTVDPQGFSGYDPADVKDWGENRLPSSATVGVDKDVGRGRYFRARFRVNEANAMWSLQGITLLGDPTSERGGK